MNFPRTFGHRRHPSGIYAGQTAGRGNLHYDGLQDAGTQMPFLDDVDSPDQFAVRASFGQSSICTRATSRYLPPSGLKIEASPSLTSNQSLPRHRRYWAYG